MITVPPFPIAQESLPGDSLLAGGPDSTESAGLRSVTRRSGGAA